MAIDTGSIQTFTDAELVILYRWALANNAAGQSRMIEGRSVTFPPLKDLLYVLDKLEARIQAEEDGTGGNIALVEFGEAQ